MTVSPKRALILGALWSISTRWSLKALGFVNTAIMARILIPADYGVVAMSMLVVGLIGSFLEFGVGTALLRKSELTRDEIDSAWSLRIIQGGMVGGLALLASPLAAMYFEEPNVLHVLWVLAVSVAVASAGNIGFVLAEKEFNYKLIFRHTIICKVIGVVVTVVGGWLFKDYRALVLGVAVGYASGLVMSFVMHPYRPRWNTSEIKNLWGTSKWLMLGGVASFVLGKGDEFLAGRIGTTTQYGQYNVGSELGQMPTSEIGPALLRSFLPLLSSMSDATDHVNSVVIKAMSALNTVTLPMGLGFAAVATPATMLILGPAWIGAAPYVAAFAIFGVISVSCGPLGPLLFYRGHARIQSMMVWIEFMVFIALSFTFYGSMGLVGLVLARIFGVVVKQGINLWVAHDRCGLSVRGCLLAVWRPALGSILMYFLVQWIALGVAALSYGPVQQLVAGVASGVSFYTIWTLLTWRLSGYPAGLEDTVFSYIQQRRRNGQVFGG